MKKLFLIIPMVAAIFALLVSAGIAATAETMTKEELKKVMDGDTVSILDVRRGKDWASSEFKIKGADRVDPGDFGMWSDRYSKENTLVLYCA